MREAVYLTMTGVVPSIEAALEMDGVMRSAAILVAKEIEALRHRETMQGIRMCLGLER